MSTARIASFFLLTFGITWGALLPALLARHHVIPGPPESYMALAPIAALGPLIAAVVLARGEPGGARSLVKPVVAGKLAWRSDRA